MKKKLVCMLVVATVVLAGCSTSTRPAKPGDKPFEVTIEKDKN